MNTCKNCKHWNRVYNTLGKSWEQHPSDLGRCSKDIQIQDIALAVNVQKNKKSEKSMCGCNIYTGKNFGCINFEPKKQ